MQVEADTPHPCKFQSTEGGGRGQPGSMCGVGLILRGDFVDVVDDEGFDGDFLRDQLQAELLL